MIKASPKPKPFLIKLCFATCWDEYLHSCEAKFETEVVGWGWINPSLVPSPSPPPLPPGMRLNQFIDRNEGWILRNPNPLISVCVCVNTMLISLYVTHIPINQPHLPESHPLYRIHFSQYQAISCARTTVFVCVSVRTCVCFHLSLHDSTLSHLFLSNLTSRTPSLGKWLCVRWRGTLVPRLLFPCAWKRK